MSKYDFVLDNMKYSFSSATSYLGCAGGFKLTYIDFEERINNAFSDYGNLIHSVLEKYFKNELELNDLLNYYKDHFDESMENSFPKYPQGMAENYYQAGIRFFENFNFDKDLYDIVFIEGYRGKELKARKYGFDIPNDVIIELVYSTDIFTPIKKDKDNRVETYEFKVTKSFDRGEIVGGFYYFSYFDYPEKNKLSFYSKSQIEKRKPDKASVEFWGGEKDVYKWDDKLKKNVKSGTEHVEGWYDEMMLKTLYRIAYSNITIDSQKIDDDFIKLSLNEKLAGDIIPDANYQAPGTANSQTLDIDSEDVTGKDDAFSNPAGNNAEIKPEQAPANTQQPSKEEAKQSNEPKLDW